MSQSELVKQLQQLSELRSQGAITDAEFTAAKQQLLTSGAAPVPLPTPPPPVLPQTPPYSPTRAFTAEFGQATRLGGTPSQAQRPASRPAPQYPVSQYPASTNPPIESTNPGSKLTGHGGALTSGVAGAVLLLAFLVLPMATVPFVGSISGSGVAGESSLFGLFGLLWLVPVEALAIMGLAALQIMTPSTPGAGRARSSLAIVFVAGGVWATYIVVLVSLQTQVSELSERLSISAFLGAGLWFALVAAAVAAVGGFVEMTTRR